MEKIKTFHYHMAVIRATSLPKETLYLCKAYLSWVHIIWTCGATRRAQEIQGKPGVKTHRQGRVTCTKKFSALVSSGVQEVEIILL